jgi:predicted acylesterase/phospholipase RssA
MALPRRALILGGGGILGAAYEVGALAALEDGLGHGRIFRDFEIFVGTSAGSFVAALAAQGIPPRELFQGFQGKSGEFNLQERTFYQVDWGRLARACWRFGSTLTRESVRELVAGRLPSLVDLLLRAQDRLPAGFIRVEGLESALCGIFRGRGLSNRFADLKTELYIPALDLDTSRRVVFGEDPQRDPTICQAVTASCAIPRFFGPVRLGGHLLVDGAIGGSLHVDIPVSKGATHVLIINPIVPSCTAGGDGGPPEKGCRTMASAGLGQILDQCLKIEHQAGLKCAVDRAQMFSPQVRFFVLEPEPRDMFPESLMDYRAHDRVLRLGYETTARHLHNQRAAFEAFFEERVAESGRHLDTEGEEAGKASRAQAEADPPSSSRGTNRREVMRHPCQTTRPESA